MRSNFLYKIVPLKSLSPYTKTRFNAMPKIVNKNKLFHPPISDGTRPWLMNEFNPVKIIQIEGIQMLELYDPTYKNVTFFSIEPSMLYKNGKVKYTESYIFEISPKIFYRFIIPNIGSVSINPTHYYDKNISNKCITYTNKPTDKPYRHPKSWNGKSLDIDDLPDYDLEVNPALISKWEQALSK